jgi:hypothetical protein
VENKVTVPIIGLYAGNRGSTRIGRGRLLEMLPSDGEADYLAVGKIIPDQARVFSLDDGEGTCVFEIAFHFIDGIRKGAEEDVCEMNRDEVGYYVSN